MGGLGCPRRSVRGIPASRRCCARTTTCRSPTPTGARRTTPGRRSPHSPSRTTRLRLGTCVSPVAFPTPGQPGQVGHDDRPCVRRSRRARSRRRTGSPTSSRLRLPVPGARRTSGHARGGGRDRVPDVERRIAVDVPRPPLHAGRVPVGPASRPASAPAADRRRQRRPAERRARRSLGRRVQRQQRRPTAGRAPADAAGRSLRGDRPRPGDVAAVVARQPAGRYRHRRPSCPRRPPDGTRRQSGSPSDYLAGRGPGHADRHT